MDSPKYSMELNLPWLANKMQVLIAEPTMPVVVNLRPGEIAVVTQYNGLIWFFAGDLPGCRYPAKTRLYPIHQFYRGDILPGIPMAIKTYDCNGLQLLTRLYKPVILPGIDINFSTHFNAMRTHPTEYRSWLVRKNQSRNVR